MKFQFALGSLALLTFALPRVARACSCSNGGARNALQHSTAVYLGEVLSTTAKRKEPVGDVRLARIRVSRAIKGVQPGDTQAVEYLVGTGGNCGLTLVRGMKLLVYASTTPSGDRLFTDYCAGTKLEKCAARDLRDLGVSVPRGARDCLPAPRQETEPAESGPSTIAKRHLTNGEAVKGSIELFAAAPQTLI
jgi:hypothetical protein